MHKKNKSKIELKPYHYNENIFVYHELDFMNDVIKPGDKIKFKNIRGTYNFIQFVHNAEKDVSWIDCMDAITGEYKSFYIEKLKGVIRPKKSRRKKQIV